MNCPNCGQQSEPGKLCTNCGAPLPVEESAAAVDPTEQQPNTAEVQNQASVTAGNAENEQPVNQGQAENQVTEQANQVQEPAKPNEFVETLKKESANFGHFFLNMLKGPDEAKKITHSSMIPAIVTMVIFSLLVALGSYLMAKQIGSMFMEISFVDSFLLPFVQFILLFAVIAALIFGGVKMAAQSLSFTDVIAKVGAYTVPFLGLVIIGSLLTLIGLSVASVLVVIGLLGPILIVPTFILLEQPTNGFDRIYVLIGIYIVSILVSGFLIQSIMNVFAGGIMGGIMDGF